MSDYLDTNRRGANSMSADMSPVTRRVIEQAVQQQKTAARRSSSPAVSSRSAPGSHATSARRDAPQPRPNKSTREIMTAIAAMT